MTIVCEDCRELCDVFTARFPPYPHFGQDEPECPEDPTYTVRRWRAPGLCPKCGQQMVRGEQRLLWD